MEDELFDIDLDSLGDDATITDTTVKNKDKVDKSTDKDIDDTKNLDLINLDDAVSDDEDGDTVDTTVVAATDDKTPQNDFIEATVTDLVEEGILPDFDIEAFKKLETAKDKADAIKEGFRGIAVSAIENFIDSLEPGMKNIMLNYREGVNLKDIVDYTDNITKWSAIKEDVLKENQELRKSVIKQDLINRQYTPEKADKLAQRSIDLGEDVEDALESHKNVIAFENSKIEYKKAEERQRQVEFEESKRNQIASIKKNIDTLDEIIPGIKLNPEVKASLFKDIITVVGQDQEGRPYNIVTKTRMQDTEDFDRKLAYYIRLGLFNKTPDVSKLTKVAATKATSKLEEAIARGPQFKSGKVYDTDADSNRVAKKILDMF